MYWHKLPINPWKLALCGSHKAIAPFLRHDEQLLVLAGAESVCKVQSVQNEDTFFLEHFSWDLAEDHETAIESA